MVLDTKRLKIIPLTNDFLKLFIFDFKELEIKLKLVQSDLNIDEHTKDALESLYITGKEKLNEYPWWTAWFIILKSENEYIGSACFKGAPDINGLVEIGYGIEPGFRNNGYMTEAVKAMCDWALKQEYVSNIIAETDIDNIPSHKVLENNKFKIYDKTSGRYLWKL